MLGGLKRSGQADLLSHSEIPCYRLVYIQKKKKLQFREATAFCFLGLLSIYYLQALNEVAFEVGNRATTLIHTFIIALFSNF